MEAKNDVFQKESPTPGCHFQVNHVILLGGYVVHIPGGAYVFSSKTPTSPPPSSADETARLIF